MFFILSKIFSWLIYPLSWIILILLCRFFVKSEQKKRGLLITAIIIFLFFSNIWIVKSFAKIWDIAPVKIAANQKYSCVILLGGFCSPDARDNGYFNSSADRFIQTVKLYKEGVVSHILVSGGNGNLIADGFKESDWTREQLLSVGIPANAILIENKSRSTLENAEFSKTVLDSVNLQPPFILVTSAFHMRRASWIFRKEGIDIIPFPANYLSLGNWFSMSDLLPQVFAMNLWSVYIKELVGYYVYKFEFKRVNTK